MQVVVKTPRIDLRMKGDIPEKIIKILREEYGELQIFPARDDELVEISGTDWYQQIKEQITPGEVLKVCRENAGLTQEALGQKVGGVPRQHISGMENNRRPIGREMAKKLAAALGVSPVKFLPEWE